MYSPRVDLAVSTLLDAHGLKKRKAGRGYEASHALAVAMIVSDYGFEEDAIIAAILHDTLEDTDLDRRVIRSTSAISCWPLWKTSPSRPRQSRGGPERKRTLKGSVH